MFLQEAKFANKLSLLDQQTSLPLHIFGSDAGGGQVLEVKQFRIQEKSRFPSHLLKRRKARCGQGSRSREALADSKGGRQRRIFEDLSQLREELIANGNELILALRRLTHQFITMTNQ